MKIGEKEVSFPTGEGGEFYLDNSLPEDTKAGMIDNLSCREIAERRKSGGNVIKPGTYHAKVYYEGGTCEFFINFPKTEDAMTDVGEVLCEPTKAQAPPHASVVPQPVMVMPTAPAVSTAPADAKEKIPEDARDEAFKSINEYNKFKFDKASF
jgi:hypothetical protein